MIEPETARDALRAYEDVARAARNGSAERNGSAGDRGRTVTAEAFAAIAAERTRWLWDRRIPLGTATLLVGREKLGKSTLTAELGAQLSRGLLEGDLAGQPAATLIVTYEDSAARTIKPRLMAAGADLERVHRVRVQRGDAADLVSLPADVESIGALAAETGARLIVIDPLSASLGSDVDGHRDQDIRRALAPLVALAERADLAVLALAHLNKAQGGDALSRVLGSRGLTAAVRSVLTFGRPPDADEDSRERVLAHPASNLAPEAPSLAYRHEGREVYADDGETIETNRLVLVGECDTRADELIDARSNDERTDTDAAGEWLSDELADGQWHESREIKARAKATGHSERTIERARARVGAERDRRGFPSVAVWRLPVPPTPTGGTGETESGGTVRTRILEPKETDPALSPATTQETGGTGAETTLATAAEEAELERLQTKFEASGGGAL
jgi:RecA-family ATPase